MVHRKQLFALGLCLQLCTRMELALEVPPSEPLENLTSLQPLPCLLSGVTSVLKWLPDCVFYFPFSFLERYVGVRNSTGSEGGSVGEWGSRAAGVVRLPAEL